MTVVISKIWLNRRWIKPTVLTINRKSYKPCRGRPIRVGEGYRPPALDHCTHFGWMNNYWRPKTSRRTGKQVGVDLGVKHLAITSDGEFFAHPKHLRKSERRIKYLQRMVSRRKKGSNRWRKAVAMLQGLMNASPTNERTPRTRSADTLWTITI